MDQDGEGEQENYCGHREERQHRRPDAPNYVRSLGCNAAELSRYVDQTLKPHMQVWDEAMLSSASWFLKQEIGTDRIYYHTFEFGSQWKRIDGCKPPRSVYTKLPDRFCFRKTSQVTGFLRRNNNRFRDPLIKRGHQQFYLLELAPFISSQSSGN